MDRRSSRFVFGAAGVVLVFLTLVVGGMTQYSAVRSLRAGVGKYAYGKPFGSGTREFRPRGTYVGRVVEVKIYALPTEEMDVPGWQSRYLLRRKTTFRNVYEAYYCTDLVELREVPPDGPVFGGFPSLQFIDIVRQDS